MSVLCLKARKIDIYLYHRSLSLWQCDNSLIVALDLCKALLPALDYLTALWPSPGEAPDIAAMHKMI